MASEAKKKLGNYLAKLQALRAACQSHQEGTSREQAPELAGPTAVADAAPQQSQVAALLPKDANVDLIDNERVVLQPGSSGAAEVVEDLVPLANPPPQPPQQSGQAADGQASCEEQQPPQEGAATAGDIVDLTAEEDSMLEGRGGTAVPLQHPPVTAPAVGAAAPASNGPLAGLRQLFCFGQQQVAQQQQHQEHLPQQQFQQQHDPASHLSEREVAEQVLQQQQQQQQQYQALQQQQAQQAFAQYVHQVLEAQQRQQQQQQQGANITTEQSKSSWGQDEAQPPPGYNPLMTARPLPMQLTAQQQIQLHQLHQHQQQQGAGSGIPADTQLGLLQQLLLQQQHAAQYAALQQAQQQRARRLPNLLAAEPGMQAAAAAAAAAAGGTRGLLPANGVAVPVAAASREKAAAVKALIDGLQMAGTSEEREPPQGLLLIPLLRHQRIALSWMSAREAGQQPRGGILADDQGLGKTVSTIALIVSNRPQPRQQGLPARLGGSSASLASAQQQQQRGHKRPRAADGSSGAAAAGSSDGSSSSDSEDDSGSSSDDEYPSSSGGEGGRATAAAPISKGGGAQAAAANGNSGRGEVICLDGASEGEEEEETGEGRLQGGTLVVCPTTVLHQWANEIRSKVTPHAGLSVHIYHGKGKAVSSRTLSHYGVVLTTYQTMALEAPRREGAAAGGGGGGAKRQTSPAAGAVVAAAAGAGLVGVGGGGEDDFVDLLSDSEEAAQQQQQQPATKRQKAMAGKAAAAAGSKGQGKGGGPLYDIMWHRVVLDEAQCIKNPRTLAAHAAWSLRAGCRWCLSGTPLQNSVEDLFPYFRFLKYEPYSKQATFRQLLRDPIAAGGAQAQLGFKRLHAVLQSVVLRRTKQSQIDGQPIVDLPPRLQELVKARMSSEQRHFYDQLKAEAGQEIKRLQAEGGGVGQQYVGVLWQLLRLRQACNHPALVKGVGAHRQAVPPAEVAAARRLSAELRAALSDLLRQAHLTPCAVCGDMPEDAVASVCRHVFCRQCAATEISNAGQGAAEAELAFHCPSPGCHRTLGKHDTFSAEALHAATLPGNNTINSNGSGAGDRDYQQQQWQQQEQGQQPGVGQQPAMETQQQGQLKQQEEQYDQAGGRGTASWQSSAKLDALMELLRKLRDKGAAAEAEAKQQRSVLTAGRSLSAARLAAALGGGTRGPQRGAGAGGSARGGAGGSRGTSPRLPMEKVIVFSQWTAMLDLAETPLRREKFQFRRLDGTMSIKARQAAIEDFGRKPEVCVMLVSLKAASLGVNLVSANHVVLLDLWFNPTVEEQAIDRAHRIGQTRPVHVTRITIEDSIEDKILALQERKRGVIAAAFGEDGAGGGGGFAARLTAEDLRYLFSDVA